MRERTTNDERRTTSNIYAVILAGGKGKRLKPLSTDLRPKAFLSVTKDKKTMFRKTVDRARRIVPETNILVVANKSHSALAEKDFPGIDRRNLLLEPVSKNTAPAIALAAFTLRERSKDAVMAVLPTDQYIAGEEKYLDAVRKGIDFVSRSGDALVVLAIKPKSATTGFGYIKLKTESRKPKPGDLYKVDKFVEKPDAATAEKLVKSGQYLWNTGSFIFRAGAILDAVKNLAPAIFEALNGNADIEKAYGMMPDISIDYAVMEKAANLYCVKGSYLWYDMGSFENIQAVSKYESC